MNLNHHRKAWRFGGECVGLPALFGAFARIFLAACRGSALEANPLAAAAGGQGHAGQWLGCGSGFAVCFGDDLCAHGYLKK